MSTVKSLSELGSIYEKSILLTESKKNDVTTKQTVGGKQDIGSVKLEKKGGDEKVKKDLVTPKEAKTEDGKPVDGEKALSHKSKIHTESKNMHKSLFDKVYNQIVSEDADVLDTPEQSDTVELEGPVADESGEVEGVESETEEVDPVAVVKQICELTQKLKQHFGISDEGLGNDDLVVSPEGDEGLETVEDVDSDEPPVEEAVDMKEVPEGTSKYLQGKKNDTGGVKVVKKSITGNLTVGDGKPQKAPCGEKLAGNKNNKVVGSGPDVKGGGVSAFEA